ncbi:hypothetical protein K402DRAFT_372658 [Aulographum hederae CBS 113979]|uniref:Uncharacterized protein n=1 Tax=Aulographum hederae CBS 113979 TaxID=1176131 RepID=A0A6G1H7A2_9PEZI|nr:hypothetical protein K402DRAFT_372658 [Aulographum hederae CBS 113979]
MATVAAPPMTTVTHAPLSSERAYASMVPSGNSSSATPINRNKSSSSHSPPSNENSAQRSPQESRTSPNSYVSRTSSRSQQFANSLSSALKVIVKKEPSSPELPTSSRHRPRKLDLTGHNTNSGPHTSGGRPSAPLTSKESAGLAIQDMGLACLSPGFHTQDPSMREHIQRSISVREQQRQIIEARAKGGKGPADTPDGPRNGDSNFRSAKTPMTSRRKGPPPGLSIAPPSHEQFANERVIQSAPLHQSFTGMRNAMQPMTRHVANQPTSLSQTSHIHHVPAQQTNNRLPPISDVFAGEIPGGPPSSRHTHFNHSPGNSSHSNIQPPLPSPNPHHQSGHHHAPTSAGRPREYKSAEEAVQSMSGGREDLLPRIVHYGGHQPPTPPSPMPPKNGGLSVNTSSDVHRSGSSRRRDRDEYERDMGTPPLGRGAAARRGPFGEGRDSPDTQQKKKQEFIQLCSRAWDLFHS